MEGIQVEGHLQNGEGGDSQVVRLLRGKGLWLHGERLDGLGALGVVGRALNGPQVRATRSRPGNESLPSQIIYYFPLLVTNDSINERMTDLLSLIRRGECGRARCQLACD